MTDITHMLPIQPRTYAEIIQAINDWCAETVQPVPVLEFWGRPYYKSEMLGIVHNADDRIHAVNTDGVIVPGGKDSDFLEMIERYPASTLDTLWHCGNAPQVVFGMWIKENVRSPMFVVTDVYEARPIRGETNWTAPEPVVELSSYASHFGMGIEGHADIYPIGCGGETAEICACEPEKSFAIIQEKTERILQRYHTYQQADRPPDGVVWRCDTWQEHKKGFYPAVWKNSLRFSVEAIVDRLHDKFDETTLEALSSSGL